MPSLSYLLCAANGNAAPKTLRVQVAAVMEGQLDLYIDWQDDL